MLIFTNMFLPVVLCGKEMYVDFYRNNEPVSAVTQSLYNIWDDSERPVDLAQLKVFEGKRWFISITNFMGVNLIQIGQPVLIRKPVFASFLLDGDIRMPCIGWALEINITQSERLNSTWVMGKVVSENCFKDCQCAAFSLGRLTLKSKMWNGELRIDLHPPFIDAMKIVSFLEPLYNEKIWAAINEIGLPILWEHSAPQSLSRDVLDSSTPVLQTFMLSKKNWKSSRYPNSVLNIWTNIDSQKGYGTMSIEYFVVDLTESNEEVFCPVDMLHINKQVDWYIHPPIQNDALKTFDPKIISKLLEQFWDTQMHWLINVKATNMARFFKMCGDLKQTSSYDKPVSSAEVILFQTVVQVWQSILKNYTFSIHRTLCSSGRTTLNRMPVPHSHSTIIVDENYIRRLLHLPLQILNPIDGSFQFVVCGLKGSEAMAFGELINVYDKYVWINLIILIVCVAVLWKIMLSHNIQQNTKYQGKASPEYSIIYKIYSLAKILVEQGYISPHNIPVSSQKIRAFVGMILIMCIIISNGYKNANVYNMVSPRKPLRYETFQELVDANFSIYTWSQLVSSNWTALHVFRWFSQNLAIKLESDQNLIYYTEDSEKELIIREAITGEVMKGFNATTSFFENNRTIDFNRLVYAKTQVLFFNVITAWLERLKKSFKNWETVMHDFDSRYGLLHELMRFEYEDIEREALLALLNDCDKTALVLPTTQAKSYAQLLTTNRGNSGKEVYFQKYAVFRIIGLVTPPFLSRLSRIKETGILEWSSKIAEYVSTVQFHPNASSDAFVVQDGPAGASLEGNIVVIFSLLLSGLGCAIIGFTSEIMFRAMTLLFNKINEVLL